MYKTPPPITRFLRPGIHVAPFLSHQGNLILLAIAREGYLAGAAETIHLASVIDPEHYRPGIAAWLLSPEPKQQEQLPFLNPGNAGPGRRTLARILWSRGVHPAPWRIITSTDTEPIHVCGQLIAIDNRHRLVATMTVIDKEKQEEVQQILENLLDSCESKDPDIPPDV